MHNYKIPCRLLGPISEFPNFPPMPKFPCKEHPIAQADGSQKCPNLSQSES